MRKPLLQVVLVSAIFAVSILLPRRFEFVSWQLNLAYQLLVCGIPWFAVGPLLRLPPWGRRAGCLTLSPILLLALFGALLTVTCDHPGKDEQLRQEIGRVQFDGYSVVARRVCGGGGATGSCWSEVVQQRLVLPGLLAHRTVDDSRQHIDAIERAGPEQVLVKYAGPAEPQTFDLEPMGTF